MRTIENPRLRDGAHERRGVSALIGKGCAKWRANSQTGGRRKSGLGRTVRGSGFATGSACVERRVNHANPVPLHAIVLDGARRHLVMFAVNVVAQRVGRRIMRLRGHESQCGVGGRGQVIFGTFPQPMGGYAHSENERDEHRSRPPGDQRESR